jgi:plastocyanin
MAPRTSLVALAGVLLALAGCGGSSSTTATTGTTAATSAGTATTPSAAGEHLSLEANREGQLKYNKTSLTAKAGEVSIDFTNMAPLDHNVTLESSSGATLGATPTFQGGTKALTLDLKPGVYKFFCSVPGHRMAGMEGTLTVK